MVAADATPVEALASMLDEEPADFPSEAHEDRSTGTIDHQHKNAELNRKKNKCYRLNLRMETVQVWSCS
jgi:hypothetical protein